MFNFPHWSDLGKDLSRGITNAWDANLRRMEEYRYYFSGDVFTQEVPMEAGSNEQAPLLYPVGINLVKMIAQGQADAHYGDWRSAPVQWTVADERVPEDSDREAIALLTKISRNSTFSFFNEIALDREVYGGAAVKVNFDMRWPSYIRWSRVPPQNFFPVFDPDDPDRLLQAVIVTHMSREQAFLRYGYKSTKDVVTRVETWDNEKYTNHLDGVRIDAFSGKNPWGQIPYVYIPRMRSYSPFGDALTEDIMRPQDELNARVADLGEAIHYNSHPVRWGVNLPKSFNVDNFPLEPNALWDMGRKIGATGDGPEVGILEAKNPVPAGVFEYIRFVYDWSRTSTFSPPIAFGEDQGGGQRSGATLEIRLWPLLRSLVRSRTYLHAGLKQAARLSASILAQKGLKDVSKLAIERILSEEIEPAFAEVMPKNHIAIVDEVVKLMATTPPSISLETAQEILGRNVGEVERIKSQLSDEELYANRSDDNDEGSVSDRRASSVSGRSSDQPGDADSE